MFLRLINGRERFTRVPGNAFETHRQYIFELLSVLGKFCFVGSDFGFWVYSKADFIQIPARLNLIWTSPLVRGGGRGRVVGCPPGVRISTHH